MRSKTILVAASLHIDSRLVAIFGRISGAFEQNCRYAGSHRWSLSQAWRRFSVAKSDRRRSSNPGLEDKQSRPSSLVPNENGII